ncbi:MAG: PDZ domain-containing protein, partial [Planctomycetota bacterium]
KEIAFVSDRSGSRQVHLVRVLPEDAAENARLRPSGPQQVTFHSEGYRLHGWYPDGKHVITTGNRDHGWRYAGRMIRVNVRERVAEEIIVDATADEPAIAPDGKRILFVREGERWWRKGYTGERSAQIWMYDTSSGEFQELLHIGVDCRSPQWDGDQEAFFFTKGDYNGASLCRFDLQTGRHQTVANFPDDNIVTPTVNRNGERIVFRHLADLHRMDVGKDRPITDKRPMQLSIRYDGDVISINDEMRRRLSSGSDIAFSDDGLEMVIAAGGDLWAMDTKLKEPVRLSDTPGFESSPVMDDEYIYTVSAKDGQTDIWRLERSDENGYWWQQQSAEWKQLTNTSEMESNLGLSPDGKFLYFVSAPGTLNRMPVAGGDTQIIVEGFSSPSYDLSPCGTWIAYTLEDEDFNDDVWIAPADGSGTPYNVSKHPDDDGSPCFSPDGKILAFTGRRVDTETDIYYVYLQSEQNQETSRQRLMEEALAAMKKKRKSGPKKKSDEKKDTADAAAKDLKKDAGTETKKDDDKKDEKTDVEKKDEKKDEDAVDPIVIDFDRLDERLKRISISDSYESGLVFSPDGKRLVFRASIDGDSGLYQVTFPDEMRPKKFSSASLRVERWSKAAGGLLGLVGSSPGKVSDSGKSETYGFSARQTYSRSEKFAEAFDQAWRTMRDRWYDPELGGRDWEAVRKKYAAIIPDVVTSDAFDEVMQLMLGELNGSHNGYYGSRDEPGAPRPAFTDITAHLGARFDSSHDGDGLLVKDVLPDTPADRVDSRLLPGDIITKIDGVNVNGQTDLTTVLNGPLNRNIQLTVRRESAAEAADEDASEEEDE